MLKNYLIILLGAIPHSSAKESSMNHWTSLRKGSTHLHISYGHTFTNNLFGYNTRIRSEPEFEIRLDLSPNLRTRNKQTNTYMDARELADGAIETLVLLQLNDKRISEGIMQYLRRTSPTPKTWKLTLEFEQEWSFEVEPEFKNSHSLHSLLLHVRRPHGDGRQPRYAGDLEES